MFSRAPLSLDGYGLRLPSLSPGPISERAQVSGPYRSGEGPFVRRGAMLEPRWPIRGRTVLGAGAAGGYCSNAKTISGSSLVTPLAVQVSIVESV